MSSNNTIIYRPYRIYKYFIAFTIISAFFFFIAFCFTLQDFGFYSFFSLVCCLLDIILTKTLYASSKISIVLDEYGVLIDDHKHCIRKRFSWECFSNAYYQRNFKGHLFLVLSPYKLALNEVKSFVSRSANLSKIDFDEVIVIYINFLQKKSIIEEIVKQHISNIENFDQDKTG